MTENKLSYKPARHAVCFLLVNDKKEVLAISRGKDKTMWGLPGGKVEPNEDLKTAVVREMYEETGYVVAAPEQVYTAMVPGTVNFICTAFIGKVVAEAPDAPRSLPYEGDVEWKKPDVLVTSSPFAEYNAALFLLFNIPISWSSIPS